MPYTVWTLVTEREWLPPRLLLPVLLRHSVAKDAVVEVDLVSAKDPCSPGVSRQHRGELVYVRES